MATDDVDNSGVESGASSVDIAEWFERYSEPLREHLVQLTGSARTAEEISQEAFLHLWFARSAGPIEDPKEFLFATALNLLKGDCLPDVVDGPINEQGTSLPGDAGDQVGPDSDSPK